MFSILLDGIHLPLIGTTDLTSYLLTLFMTCFIAVLGFEVVNGFHDTANAVATVIYTNTLKPSIAIIWSGLCNFLGVFVIGTAVAMSLLQLVPLDRILNLPVEVGAYLVIAILLASIIWNLSTWYIGLPLSSSHTLIGAMIGAGLGFSMYYGGNVNWEKAKEIGLSLLLSPIIGFAGSSLLMYLEKKYIKSDALFHAPVNKDDRPPLPIRILLVITCALVSFFHGSNDGQKGVGLLMLVLIAFLPLRYMLNPDIAPARLHNLLTTTQHTLRQGEAMAISAKTTRQKSDWLRVEKEVAQAQKQALNAPVNSVKGRYDLRKQVQTIVIHLRALTKSPSPALSATYQQTLLNQTKALEQTTDFAPVWVLIAISLALGLGTTVGWKRIVITVGERIGAENLTYAQGATAEVVAASTIGLSTLVGLPVSTTHVLSSGVAGTMVASGGIKNLNYSTLKHIATAWILTLPVAILLALLFFTLFYHLILS